MIGQQKQLGPQFSRGPNSPVWTVTAVLIVIVDPVIMSLVVPEAHTQFQVGQATFLIRTVQLNHPVSAHSPASQHQR